MTATAATTTKQQPLNDNKTHNDSNADSTTGTPTLITDDAELRKYGIVRASIPSTLNCQKWAALLTEIPPMALMFEGDNELPLYRNILETAPDFPVEIMLVEDGSDKDDNDNNNTLPSIAQALYRYFPLTDNKPLSDQLKLDDAFCVSYNDHQSDTTGAKHQDPSDITVNLCLEKSDDCEGSKVLFHGRKALEGMGDDSISQEQQYYHDKILVEQIPGTATIHFGNHAHETTALENGSCRTNVILTYWYTDRDTGVATRSCYT